MNFNLAKSSLRESGAWYQIEVMPRDARAVGEHVADGHGRVQEIVVEVDPRDGLAHRFVPRQLPLFHQQARGNGGEELRVRGDLVERAGRERKLRAVIPVAVAFRENKPVADDDADTDPRDVPVLDGPGHPRVEVFELRGGFAVQGFGGETAGDAKEED